MATDHAAALEHPLVGLVFVTAREMYRDSWQHRFLVGYFRERNIPAVDMKDVILRDARARDRSIRDYFLANDGHPSALGNQVVAEAVARLIAEGDLLPAGKGE